MAQVRITILGRTHAIACGDGEEDHVRRLAEYVDARVSEIAKEVDGRASEALLLAMVSLMLADELADAQAAVERLAADRRDAGGDPAAHAADLGDLAERIETIADRLNAA